MLLSSRFPEHPPSNYLGCGLCTTFKVICKGDLMGASMGVDDLLRKALRLVGELRVFRESNDVYHVRGNLGFYLVQRSNDGQLACTCRGFSRRGRCSHVIAVSIAEAQGKAMRLPLRKEVAE